MPLTLEQIETIKEFHKEEDEKGNLPYQKKVVTNPYSFLINCIFKLDDAYKRLEAKYDKLEAEVNELKHNQGD